MRTRRRSGNPLLALIGAAAVAACSSDGPAAPDPSFLIEPGTGTLQITVCKIANDAETLGDFFTFNTSAAGGTVVPEVSIEAQDLLTGTPNKCARVWSRPLTSFDDETQVTITEVLDPGHDLVQVSFLTQGGDPAIPTIFNPATNSVTVVPRHGLTILFKNVEVATPVLSLTKVAGSTTVNAGSPMSFTVRVENTGTGAATGVTVSDALPGGVGIDWSITTSDPTCTITGATPSETLSCSFGDLPAGQSRSVTVTTGTTGAECKVYSNTATAQATNHGVVQASAAVTMVNCPTICTAVSAVPALSSLTNLLFVFADGSEDANWQGASKGFAGNVAVDGIQAKERTSGTVPYAGTIYTNDSSLGAWQAIVNQNAGQAFASVGNGAMIAGLEADLATAFSQINALASNPPAGFTGSPTSLNGLNTQNGVSQTFVLNVTSGFQVSSKIQITGDAGDVFILRWDTDANFANGYQGQVKFQSGGAIVPLGGLGPDNFVHVAGDLSASGGGSNPAPPYPQGPGIPNGDDWNGGGFFTGYWLTTGDADRKTHSFSNAIFVGGWYTTTVKFSMTSGTSGVHVPCI